MINPLYLDGFLIALVLTACMQDLAVRKIPNRLLACGLFSATVLHLFSASPVHLISVGLAGCAVGLLVFLPLYLLRGMAAGDVKLMATVGAFTGPVLALEIALAAFCAGGVMALVMVFKQRRWGDFAANMRTLLRPLYMRAIGMPYIREPFPAGSVGGMPYGVAIASATCLMLWIRHC